MKKSNIQFRGYKIIESHIKCAESIDSESKLKVNLSLEGSYKSSGTFILDFDAEILNEEESIVIQIKSKGMFGCTTEDPKDPSFANLLALNAPAILFPYVRAYISTLTSLSGLEPVTLPTLNLSEFKDGLLENIKYED